MFSGHYGLGLGSKEADRRVPLWTLLLAVQWLDLVWGVLILTGVEHARIVKGIDDATDIKFTDYPYSHSLLAALIWAGLAYLVVKRFAPRAWRTKRSAVLVSALVFSHWPLDLIVHQSDMPLWSNAHKVGLNLWSSAPATYIVEMALVGGGLWLYVRATQATSAVGRFGPWVLALVLVVAGYSTVFGTASSVKSTAAGGVVAIVVLPFFGWVIERGRVSRPIEDRAPARYEVVST